MLHDNAILDQHTEFWTNLVMLILSWPEPEDTADNSTFAGTELSAAAAPLANEANHGKVYPENPQSNKSNDLPDRAEHRAMDAAPDGSSQPRTASNPNGNESIGAGAGAIDIVAP
jgi:hypothetical protein